MKKYFGLIVLFVGIVIGLAIYSSSNITNALGMAIRSGSNVPDGTYKLRTNNSTNTPNRITTGTGTTTLTFESENLNSVGLNMLVKLAVGSNRSYLDIKPQASDDAIDWFDYDPTTIDTDTVYAATSSLAMASTTWSMTYRPSTVGNTTTKAFIIPLQPARYTRLVFTLATSTAMSVVDVLDLWASVITEVNTNR